VDQQSLIKNRLNRENILQAAERFNEKKYSKELYFYYLNVLKNDKQVTAEIKEAVEYLQFLKEVSYDCVWKSIERHARDLYKS
jgi:hypothetical protein